MALRARKVYGAFEKRAPGEPHGLDRYVKLKIKGKTAQRNGEYQNATLKAVENQLERKKQQQIN